MAWILLVVAGLLEVVWAIGMKYTQGWTRLWPSVVTVVAMILSFLLLSRAMVTIPLSLAYTIWVGIGAIGSVVAGVVLFNERLVPLQYLCIALIALGIFGLKATSAPPAGQP